MEKFMELVKVNKVASVTRLYGNSAYDLYPEKHLFDENGFLKAWYTSVKQNGIFTYETDTLGRVIKSYTYEYPKTEEFTLYSTYVLDSLGNRIRQEHFYANGERYHYSEAYEWSDEDFHYIVDVVAGKDSSVIRIETDTMSNISIASYIQYRDGYISDFATYFDEFNDQGKVIKHGKIHYDNALRSWLEDNADESQYHKMFSYAHRDSIIHSNSLDTALFEYIVHETYSYYENGAIKSKEDYDGIRVYEYNKQGFPIKVTKKTKENKVKSIITFTYHDNGLLQRETIALPNGEIKEVINYKYTFW